MKGKSMKKYSVQLGMNVCAYKTIVIEAENIKAAEKIAYTNLNEYVEDGTPFKPDWTTGYEYRIVEDCTIQIEGVRRLVSLL